MSISEGEEEREGEQERRREKKRKKEGGVEEGRERKTQQVRE